MSGAREQRRTYLTPLIDRKEELAWLEERVTLGERLVTIFGPPGVGKTRLAAELLDASRTAGIEGHFCELFEARTEEDVATEVLRAMFPGDVPGGAPRDAVAAALAARGPALVVLDNFEHLTHVALPMLAAWVARCTQTTFVVTSREVLRLPGEAARELAPLRVPSSPAELSQAPAARLLLESVARYRKLALDRDEEALLCDLVQRLDGLPLALEIVAPSIALVGTRVVHERLDRVLSDERARAGPARTLRETIAWSWVFLGDEERVTLATCAIFQGGFTIEALEATARAPNETDGALVLPRLMSLRDKSLIHALPSADGGAPRFGTYAAITEFALEQLELMGMRDEAERRHRAYFAERARQRTSRPGAETLAFMRAERANLMAAVERARPQDPTSRADVFAILALFGPPLFVGERRARIVALLERAFATFGEGDDLATGYALSAKGQFLLYTENMEMGRRDLTRALAIARGQGDKRLEAQVVTHLQRVNPDRAGKLVGLAYAVSLAREVGDFSTLSVALGRIAITHCNAGDTALAVDAAHEAVRVAPDPASQARATVVSAYVNLARGDFRAAMVDSDEALERAARHGFNAMEGDAFISRATLLHLIGRIEEADDAYRVAVQRLEEVARDKTAGAIRVTWALLLFEREDPRRALEIALRAVGHLDTSLDPMRPPALLDAVIAMARARIDRREVDARVFHVDVEPEVAVVLELLEIVEAIDAGGERRARAQSRFDAIRAEGEATSRRSVERTLVYGMIERMLRGEQAPVSVSDSALVVQANGDWFRMPRGDVVSCEQRQVLRPLLRALAEARRDRPGEPVSVDALRRAGWPDERMGEESARNRLKQSMAVLRRLGLGDALSSGRAGYMLVPSLPLRIVE